jgi:hypothetical protein
LQVSVGYALGYVHEKCPNGKPSLPGFLSNLRNNLLMGRGLWAWPLPVRMKSLLQRPQLLDLQLLLIVVVWRRRCSDGHGGSCANDLASKQPRTKGVRSRGLVLLRQEKKDISFHECEWHA